MSMPVKIGQWGGAGGKPCDIKYTPHALTRVKVRSGDYVDAIGFTCMDISGNLHVEEWGGSGGKTHEFVLGDSEYLKEISGTYDEALRSLKFVTNTGQVFEYGNATGAYSFDVPLINAKITGFLGRTGNYIDAIGVYVLPA